MIKLWILLLLCLLLEGYLIAQRPSSTMEGEVIFTTSVNIYVRFQNTESIHQGDTLLIQKDGQLNPCLIVVNKSSSSCVCTRVNDCEVIKGQKIIFRPNIIQASPNLEQKIKSDTIIKPNDSHDDNETSIVETQLYKEKIRGRISLANYSNFSAEFKDQHRQIIRGRLTAENINDSRISFDSYINYRRTMKTGTETVDATKSFLRVYNLSLKYALDQKSSVVLGRRINPKISSLGAIDGLQAEKYFGNFYSGVVAGFRPDIAEYGLNTNLLQYGAYLGTQLNGNAFSLQSTIGLLEQRNAGSTDRRYAYFQFSSTFFNKFTLFSSAEMDLYKRIGELSQSDMRLSNLFISGRYKVSRALSLSASYDSRKRIIYYETDRTLVEELLADDLTRQGIRFRVTIRPAKYISTGISYSRRFQSDGENKSNNINGFISLSNIPGIGGRIISHVNWNKSNFLESRILSIRYARPIIKNALDMSVYYRLVKYNYLERDIRSSQNYYGADLSLRINRQLRLSLLGERSTYVDQNKYRFNIRLTKRFGK